MNILQTIVIVVHILAAFVIIGLVLLQHGKGADMGASFGSGSAGSLFGATGSANFLSRTTAVIATVFFLTSLSMAYFATSKPRQGTGTGVMEGVSTAPAPASVPGNKPVAPTPAVPPSPAAIPGQEAGKAAAPAGAAAPAAPAAAAPAPAAPAPAAPAAGSASGEASKK